MGKFIDLRERQFGRLIVNKRTTNDKRGNSRWLCLCGCGTTTIVIGYHLKSGHTRSCGCLGLEGNNTKHGRTKGKNVPKSYTTWVSMKQRCANPNTKCYKNYGGRGIKVCERWKKFPSFLEDMGEPPTNKHSIDRIDNDGDYCPENCIWATAKEQNRNSRNNHIITFNGKTQCIAEWSEELNIKYGVLWSRLYLLNWPIEKALFTPVKSMRSERTFA